MLGSSQGSPYPGHSSRLIGKSLRHTPLNSGNSDASAISAPRFHLWDQWPRPREYLAYRYRPGAAGCGRAAPQAQAECSPCCVRRHRDHSGIRVRSIGTR